jgi:hypothetical protein
MISTHGLARFGAAQFDNMAARGHLTKIVVE